MSLLEISHLYTTIPVRGGQINAVNDLSLSIRHGETVAIVGESGSGKSITARSIMGILPPPGKITSGSIIFEGRELVGIAEEEMRKIRGSRIAMIFQEPMTSLNPVMRIGNQLTEPLILHRGFDKSSAMLEAERLLKLVGINSAESRISDYPHQLSGGMRQRVMIAMALACSPALLIADEPTTALDVTIQAQILELIDKLRREQGLALLLITHDLGVVAERADSVNVMYAGRIVESAPTEKLISSPAHPYSRGLLASLPENGSPGSLLHAIKGHPVDLSADIRGCPFSERCPEAFDRCQTMMPPEKLLSDKHRVLCWKYI